MPPKGYVDRMLDVNEVDLCEVYKKFNFTEKMVKECLEHIRDWYLKQPHLPEQAWDADRVLRFLFMSKFSVENTKSRLDRMLTARADVPEFLADRDPLSPDMLMFQNCVEFAVLPKMVGDGRVTMVRFLKDFPEDLEPSLIIKFALMVADYRLMYDVALAEHMVIDLNHLKIAYFSRFTPTLAKKANYILQSCLGAKVGGIYLVNVPAYADMTINMFKIVLKKKIADRIKIYKSYEDLKKVFPTDILPSDLGGQEKSISEITADVYAALRSPEWRKWFLNEGAMKSDESKRQTEKTNFDVELGVHGCFRKLDVD